MEDTRGADAQTLGIAAPEIPPEEAHCEVWAEHVTALEVFLACARQWRVIAGFGGACFQGIDAAALQATMTMLGVDNARETLLQVQEIEDGALEKLNS